MAGGLAHICLKGNSGSRLELLRSVLERTKLFIDAGLVGFERLLQHQTIQGHDGEGGIIRLQQKFVARRHLCDLPLYIEANSCRNDLLHLDAFELLKQFEPYDLQSLLRDERELGLPDGSLERQPPGEHLPHVIAIRFRIALANDGRPEQLFDLTLGYSRVAHGLATSNYGMNETVARSCLQKAQDLVLENVVPDGHEGGAPLSTVEMPSSWQSFSTRSSKRLS